MRVLLVCMPFAGVDRPALGLSVLKAAVSGAGMACDVAYLNVSFAEKLGLADYEAILRAPETALAGEWVFAGALQAVSEDGDGDYVDDVLRRTLHHDTATTQAVLRARSFAPGFLKTCLTSLPWRGYDVVGFGSAGAQNVAALALARMLKERHPGLTVVFGGHNWSGEMGRTLFRLFPFVDYAFTGEADLSFPELLRAVAYGDGTAIRAVPGLLRRTARGRPRVSPDRPPEDLDAVPLPEHEDYFDALAPSGLSLPSPPVVPLETSRGCWWAARGGCTFCGLNGDRLRYRAKSPQRTLLELETLSCRWPGLRLDVVDNVVPPGFITRVLPRLARGSARPALGFRIRPDVTWPQLEAVAAAGGSVVCGIESLDDRLLAAMHKGTDALQNVRVLKWCDALGVPIAWNLLFGLPGEQFQDYAAQMDLMSSISFAEAPVAVSPIVVERSSILWHRPVEHGLGELRPARAYAHIYPFGRDDLAGLAYFFEHEYRPGTTLLLQLGRLQRRVQEWRDRRDPGRLVRVPGRDGVVRLRDTRRDAEAAVVRLDGAQALLFDACDDARHLHELLGIARHHLDPATAVEEVEHVMASLVRRRLVVTSGDRFLNLSTPPRPARTTPCVSRMQAAGRRPWPGRGAPRRPRAPGAPRDGRTPHEPR